MKKPKNLDQFTTPDDAAGGLEALARDIRAKSEDGLLVRWNINMNFWHPSWDRPAKPTERIGTVARGGKDSHG
jgi:hypothetical protein